MEVSTETRKALLWAKSEISAGRVMFPKTEVELAYNLASERAMDILTSYVYGNGLYQITDCLDGPKFNAELPSHGG